MALKQMNDCHIQFNLYTHRSLSRIQRLIKENSLIGRFEVIPGLKPKEVILPGTTKKKSVPCLGADELVNEKSGSVVLPAKASVEIPTTLRFSTFEVIIEDRLTLETSLLKTIEKKISGNQQTASSKISRRFLKIGQLVS